MATTSSIKEIVWTPTKNSGKDVKNSPLWKGCYRDEEMTNEIEASKNTWYRYVVKFDGLTPMQVTKSSEFKKA